MYLKFKLLWQDYINQIVFVKMLEIEHIGIVKSNGKFKDIGTFYLGFKTCLQIFNFGTVDVDSVFSLVKKLNAWICIVVW